MTPTNRNILIGAAVIVLLVLGYMYFGGSGAPEPTATPAPTTPAPSTPAPTTTSPPANPPAAAPTPEQNQQ